MLISALLSTYVVSFTPAKFEGFTVPVPAPVSAPVMNGRKKLWSGVADCPLDAGYKKTPIEPWTNPYYKLSITPIDYWKGARDEASAFKMRLKEWARDDIWQVAQRISLTKIGKVDLAIEIGSALQRAKKGPMPVFFIECFLAKDKKLYEYRFVSTKSSDIELALKALPMIALECDGADLKADDLPETVAGEYSVGMRIVVETPIIPVHGVALVFVLQKWLGTIGDPANGGFYLAFAELQPHPRPYGSRDLRWGEAASDQDTAAHMLKAAQFWDLMLKPGDQGGNPWLELEVPRKDISPLASSKLYGTIGTASALYVASAAEGETVFSGSYRRESLQAALLACRGDQKLGDGRIRLKVVEPDSILAPRGQ